VGRPQQRKKSPPRIEQKSRKKETKTQEIEFAPKPVGSQDLIREPTAVFHQ